ncbi:MAG: hypothetical protein U1F43_11090 [Myxococcota bacterium]
MASLFRLDAMALSLNVAGGMGLDQDSAYLYAGARIELMPSHDVGLELAYTYHLGDTHGEDVTWKDHAFGATVVLRSVGISLGGEYRMGDARRYSVVTPGQPAVERPQKDQLWKGDYGAFVFTAAYNWF